jgi:hypothetical protein
VAEHDLFPGRTAEGTATIMRVSNHYDIPRDGTAWYLERRWYFSLIDDDYGDEHWLTPSTELRYGLWDLTQEQWGLDTEANLDFDRLVGGSFSMSGGPVKGTMAEFYEKWDGKLPRPDLDTEPEHVVYLTRG